MRRSAFPLLLALLGLSACGDRQSQLLEPSALARPLLSASTTTTHFEQPFEAIARCGEPIGDIRFFGIISGVDHTTVDGQGRTHRTRVFRVQGLEGENLLTGTRYDVQGGAEMITWHTHLGQQPGNVNRSIHAGTLVFEPVDGGSRVVAQHRVRYFEDPDGEIRMDYHEWRCVSQGPPS